MDRWRQLWRWCRLVCVASSQICFAVTEHLSGSRLMVHTFPFLSCFLPYFFSSSSSRFCSFFSPHFPILFFTTFSFSLHCSIVSPCFFPRSLFPFVFPVYRVFQLLFSFLCIIFSVSSFVLLKTCVSLFLYFVQFPFFVFVPLQSLIIFFFVTNVSAFFSIDFLLFL